MNEASLWREELARSICLAYTQNTSVDAVMIAGSVSRGMADKYSDIEVHIFWSQSPSDEERIAAMKRADGILVDFYPYEEDEWSEVYKVQGVKIEVSQFLSNTIEQYIKEVVEDCNMNIDKQVLLASVQYGLPIYGHDKVNGWKKCIEYYPDSLVNAVVEQHLNFDALWYYESLAYREDWLMSCEVYSSVIKNMIGVLHGLNRMYIAHPRYKWVNQSLEEMKIKPHNLNNRLQQSICNLSFGEFLNYSVLQKKFIR